MGTQGLTTVAILSVGFCFGFYIDFMFLYLNFNLKLREIRNKFKNNGTLSNGTLKSGVNADFENVTLDLQSTFAKIYLQGVLEVQARQFASQTSIFCLLRTEGYLHEGRAQHAAATWVKHCNSALFISDKADKTLPSVNVTEKTRWTKTLAGIKILNRNYSGQFNWTIVLEDDTYVIIENLRELLHASYSPQTTVYFKFDMNEKPPQRYQARDMGFVLSSKSVEMIASKANSTAECADDKHLESCCIAVGLTLGDLRDPAGGYRVFPFDLRTGVNTSLENDKDWWDWEHTFWPAPQPPYCCSDRPVTFHFVSPTMMYALEFMIYYLGPASLQPLSLPWSQIISNLDLYKNLSSSSKCNTSNV